MPVEVGSTTPKNPGSPELKTSPLTAKVIRTCEELVDCAPEWNDLLAASSADTIFLTWDWIASWLETVMRPHELFVIAVRDGGGALLGIAPFYPLQLRAIGGMRYRALQVLGDWLAGGEYMNIIVRRGKEHAALSAIRQKLVEHQRDWDCIWVPTAIGWSGGGTNLEELAHLGRLLIRSYPRPFSAIPLPASFDAYLQDLSKNTRHHLARTTRKVLDKMGAKVVRCQDVDQLETMLQHLVEMNTRRWESAGKGGTFRYPQRRRFYQSLGRRLLARGQLGFYGLTVDGNFQALWFGMVYNGIYYSLVLGYDVGFEARHHTGIANVLFGVMVRDLISSGITEFDHLGGLAEYKARWGARPRWGRDYLICRRSIKGRVLYHSGIWPTGRYITEERVGVAESSEPIGEET